jgi:hypothetical protein
MVSAWLKACPDTRAFVGGLDDEGRAAAGESRFLPSVGMTRLKKLD